MNALAQAARAAPAAPAAPEDAGGTVFARGMISEDAPATPGADAAVAPASTTPAAAAALDPDAVSSPGLERLERLLGNKGVSPEQRAALAKMSPQERQMIEKASRFVAWLPKIIVGIIVLWIVVDFGTGILSLIRSFL